MKILLVEDDVPSRKNLSEFLISLGHSVIESSDGKDAIEILKKEKVSLVLSDIFMPRMDGYELLKHIKQSRDLKDIIVVLITGQGDIKGAIEAMRVGAYDYLLKPISVKELAITIEKIDEYIHLKQEHMLLKKHFEQRLGEATKKIKTELSELKKAFAREVGIDNIGIFVSTKSL